MFSVTLFMGTKKKKKRVASTRTNSVHFETGILRPIGKQGQGCLKILKGSGIFARVRCRKFFEEIYGLSFFPNPFSKSSFCFDFIIGERRIWIKFVMQFDPDV